MCVSKLTEGGDWSFGKGRADYINNSAQVAQKIYTALRFFLNDWAFDDKKGIDWLTIMGSKNNTTTIRNEIVRTVINVSGVQTLDELTFEVDRVQRKLTATLRYTDIYEETTTITITVPIPIILGV